MYCLGGNLKNKILITFKASHITNCEEQVNQSLITIEI